MSCCHDKLERRIEDLQDQVGELWDLVDMLLRGRQVTVRHADSFGQYPGIEDVVATVTGVTHMRVDVRKDGFDYRTQLHYVELVK